MSSGNDRDGDAQRSAAVYALVKRLGGSVTIPWDELPQKPYTIWRHLGDNGLDIKIIDDPEKPN